MKKGKEIEELKLKDESEYNKEYLGETNYIVLDKVFYKNIEFCDLLYYENGKTFLFHNKIGFDGDMRILSEQVLLSALTLIEEQRVGIYSKISEYYKSLENKNQKGKSMEPIGKQSEKISKKNFLDKFNEATELNFVLGFTYKEDIISIFKSKDEHKIINKLDNLSIIAKYELLNLLKTMRAAGINFYITQIKTPS